MENVGFFKYLNAEAEHFKTSAFCLYYDFFFPDQTCGNFFTFFCQICKIIFFTMYVLALKAVICISGQHYMHAELGHVVDPL